VHACRENSTALRPRWFELYARQDGGSRSPDV